MLMKIEHNTTHHIRRLSKMLKWGTLEESNRAAERLNKLVARVVGSKALYLLIVLAAFVLLTGAANKWGG